MLASVLPSPVPSSGPNCILKVLPLSDLHLPTKPSSTELLLSNRAYLEGMNYVVLLGDMVACYGTKREYQAVGEFVRRLARPYSVINGNHEFYFNDLADDSPDYGHLWLEQTPEGKGSKLDAFRAFFEMNLLWRAQRHELGLFLFLGLDGIQYPKVETLSRRQLSFLLQQLEAAPDLPAYVFCHAPLLLRDRLDMEYYDAERTACVELTGRLRDVVEARSRPLFWMSGHIHLRPDHYLFAPYQIAANVWQVHCPDSWGYSRWQREHRVPQRHDGLFSRSLEISERQVRFVTHDHQKRTDVDCRAIEF